MRKVISCVLAVIMIVSICVFGIVSGTNIANSAEGTPTLDLSSSALKVFDAETDIISINLTLSNVPEFESFSISGFTYDTSVLELVSFKYKISGSVRLWNKGKANFVADDGDEDFNGLIAVVTFKVKNNAHAYSGNYNISCSFSAKNADGENVPINVSAANVALTEICIGDMDENGTVEVADAIYLLYYIFYPQSYSVNIKSDFDNDNETTTYDVIYLLYHTFYPGLYPLDTFVEPTTEAPTEDRSLIADDNLFSGTKRRVANYSNSAYTIYYSSDVYADAAFALQDAIKHITGAELRVVSSSPSLFTNVIIIGDSSFAGSRYTINSASLGANGFVIKVVNGNIILYGKTSGAALEAVYTLCDDYFGFDAIYDREVCERGSIYVPQTLDRTEYRNYDFSTSVPVSGTPCFTVYQGDEFVLSDLLTDTLGTTMTPCFSNYAQTTALITATLKGVTSGTSVVKCIFNKYTVKCTCDSCKAAARAQGTDAGAYYNFINRLADALKAKAPNAKLEILAYKDTYIPPNTALKGNVSVYVYNPHVCSAHAIDDPDCDINAEYADVLATWKTKASRVYVIDTTADYDYYPSTFPNWNCIYDNMKYYNDIGIDRLYYKLEAKTDLESILEFRDMRQYLVDVMASNIKASKADFSSYIDNYLVARFGIAGKKLRSYMDKFALEASKHCYDIYSKPSEILAIPRIQGETGVDSYDLTLAQPFYNVWADTAPDGAAAIANETLLGKMAFRYMCTTDKSDNLRRAKIQFNEWLLANLDVFDATDVINRLIKNH